MTTTKADPPDTTETEIIRVAEARAVEAHAKGKKLRDRAEECRALARIMTSAANAASYLNLAEAYDGLAEHQEWLALSTVKFKTIDEQGRLTYLFHHAKDVTGEVLTARRRESDKASQAASTR